MKKVVSLLLVFALILALVCVASAEGIKVDDLAQVELRMFAIADAPKNAELSDEFFTLFNEKLTEKLHCTINYEYAAGNDYKNNYQLALASGEKYDLIHAASGWLDYSINASKGAYLALDELLPEYAPYIWGEVSTADWNAVKVNGKIYGVPTTYHEWAEPSFFYRLDLCEKYGLERPHDYESIAAYLQAIKDNEPDMLPSDDYQAQVYGTLFMPTQRYLGIDEVSDRHYNFCIDPENPRKVLSVIELPEYKEFMYMMKDWADRGFWPRSCLSSLEWGVFSVLSGKAAASFNGQFNNYNWMVPENEKANPGWKLDYVTYGTMVEKTGMTAPSATSGMLAITRNAENIERALMLIDLIHQDQELYDLANYGIEGKNYTLREDGAVDTSSIDLSIDGYNYFPGGLFADSKLRRAATSEWEETEARMEVIRAAAAENILDGFVLDMSNVQAEYTALNQVRIQYAFPLQAGQVEDVDAAYAELLEQANAAGMEACRAELERMLNEFFDAKGL